MSSAPERVEIFLGVRGAIHLSLTPKSTLKLTSAPTPLDKLTNEVTLEGTCERIPDGTACEIELIHAEYDTKAPRPVLRPPPIEGGELHGVLKVTGTTCEVQRDATGGGGSVFVLDVFEHELVGKGRLHVVVKPELSGCNMEGPPAEAVFPFDNQITFTVSLEGAALMGTMCTFIPAARTGVFQDVPVRLIVEEYDAPASPDAAGDKEGKDLRVELEWGAGDTEGKTWRVGCQERTPTIGDSPAVVDLVYPEPNEIPPYEFAYTVQAKLGERWITLPYGPIQFAPSVPKPGLTAFELALVTGEGEAEREVQVKLGFSGFAQDISFEIHLSIWRAEKVGDELEIERVAVPDIFGTYVVAQGEMVFSTATTLENLGGCFAVLGIPGVSGYGFGDARIPITAVIDCSAGEHYRAFEEVEPGKTGRLLDPGKNVPTASGVASKEASRFLKLD